MLFKNPKQLNLSDLSPNLLPNACGHSEHALIKQQLQQLISLLLLWRQLPKYRNLLNEAKIGLLRHEIKFSWGEFSEAAEFMRERYSEIYTLALYTAAIQAQIRYTNLPSVAPFTLTQSLDLSFFPISGNVYQLIKTNLSDNLKHLGRYFIYRSRRLK